MLRAVQGVNTRMLEAAASKYSKGFPFGVFNVTVPRDFFMAQSGFLSGQFLTHHNIFTAHGGLLLPRLIRW